MIVPPQAYAGDFPALTGQVPRLRVVQALSAGVDQYRTGLPPYVDLFNASNVHVAATAEWVVAAVLASERNLMDFAQDRADGTWRPRATKGPLGSRVIVIGAGEIGIRVAQLLTPFGAMVTLVGRASRVGVESIDDMHRCFRKLTSSFFSSGTPDGHSAWWTLPSSLACEPARC